ncbi:HTH-type transcriptional regulator [Legionella geestiana]|uniref:HTH-type transcriptional regulator n=1 Tax=Legionella geestiana TaxID=45065 RepID=A0A0W0U7R8_9GAMM|nr:S24 family peptidase [Legionella geestiana]KTD03803.1 HTH-type transcriptional regulator [Legionella geestiana]QBS11911.1 helix-turn-helix domain-containing protein [Legionella geestiana]QDQ40476.1 helix-turn-helix domain-containing protein [Legionella geestiana]STX53377.1 HTH-type transcriptional regulator [Legionella geestiana]
MTSIAENINTLMEEEGITASDLSRLTGVDRSVLHKILSGATKNPSIDSIKRIIERYGYEPVVMGKKLDNLSAKLPIISWEQAILLPSLEILKNPKEFIVFPSKHNASVFGLYVLNAYDNRFPEGTLLVVDQEREAVHLSFVIINEQDRYTAMKRLIFDGGRAFLKSLEPTIPSIQFDRNLHKIVGVVVQSIFSFNN